MTDYIFEVVVGEEERKLGGIYFLMNKKARQPE